MLNYLWAGMVITGVIFGILTGKTNEVSEAFLSSSKEAVSLCITMAGVVAMWSGIMEIAKESGLTTALSRKMKPLIRLLFPGIPKDDIANEYIATNMMANILGLGWAATPSGLLAMKELHRLNKEKETASNDMCTFLVINISSLQLIPINIIAYRMQYGSVNPTQIVAPSIVATLVSTLVAIFFCLIMGKRGVEE
ncbi:MAG: nucleoside recognition protein [Lachnospiraceae bacterium]|nr:nucleoside recognition protein [Lachnospiraceae bacterium]